MNWLRSFFTRDSQEHDLDRELRFHKEEAFDRKISAGITPQAAHREVAIEFGGTEQIKEECRDVQRVAFLENLFLDARYASRSLMKTPSFTILAILILSLGIGANTAIFSVVNAILLRPLPFADPDRLVAVTGFTVRSQAALDALRNESKLVDYAAYTQSSEVNLTGDGEPARVVSSSVSANLFAVLGVKPRLGRTFRDGEDRSGAPKVIALSHSFWQTRFGGDPNVIGKILLIDEEPREVVAVMPPEFRLPSPKTQLWVPITINPGAAAIYYWMDNLPIFGRLRPGAEPASARAEFGLITGRLKERFYRRSWGLWGNDATLGSLRDTMVKDVRKRLFLLLGAVGLVLLIACANFANLLVVRTIVRRKELAVRAALGASRFRLLQQVLMESLLLAMAGGILGLASAWAGTTLLAAGFPADTPRLAEIGIDLRVLEFTAALSILTGIGFGLIPALRASRQDAQPALREGARSLAGGQRSILGTFVVIEIAVSVIVVGAGLMVKSLWLLSNINPGFEASHVLSMQITPNESLCGDQAHCIAYYRNLTERVKVLPGVSNAAAVSSLALTQDFHNFAAELEGHPNDPGGPAPMLWFGEITTEYLQTMTIPLLAGERFSAATAGQPVVLVSATTAKRYWPGQSPIGKHLRGVWQTKWRRVIGVVGDVKTFELGADPEWLQGAVYFPHQNGLDGNTASIMTLVVKTPGDPLAMAATLRKTVAGVSVDVPVSHIQSLDEVVSNSIAEPRSLMWLLTALAGLALLLGAVGIYGVLSYTVTQRVREIGVRMALGAVPSQIRILILGQTLRYTGAGLVLGLAGAVVATRFLRSQLFQIGTTDTMTYCIGLITVMAVALIAAWAPTRRAVALDPAIAIRED